MGANLRKMEAYHTDFTGSNFTAARFDDAQIRNCDFGKVMPRLKTNFVSCGVAVYPTAIARSVFNKCVCIHTYFKNVSIQYCDLTDTVWTSSTWHTVNATGAQCGGSVFRKMMFVDCDLSATDFTGCDLTDAHFEGTCDLTDACFMCATIAGTYFDDRCVGKEDANFTSVETNRLDIEVD